MAVNKIINLAEYRQNHANGRQGEAGFSPSSDRLWEYLARNIKISVSEADPLPPQGKTG